MAKLEAVCRMASDRAPIADFLVVYIEEAHPTDGWAFKDNFVRVSRHRTIDDRIAAARIVASSAASVSSLTVVADTMSDSANRAYGGLFERLYVIEDGLVAYQGERGPSGFRLDEVERWLDQFVERQRRKTTANMLPAAEGGAIEVDQLITPRTFSSVIPSPSYTTVQCPC
jgi:hypothetical protein